jgi:recombinational DNA repair ATPase RecF
VDEQLQRETLPDEVALLVLAALDGDEQLDEYLADGTTIQRVPPREAPTESGGVVLTSITVEGFRGIGPAATLAIVPRPGLTVVAGRNGSGKSSFSEALELVLTGDTYRWSAKRAEWRDQWRNLHHPHARIAVGLVQEGVGPLTVTASWSDDEPSVGAHRVTSQVTGQRRLDGTAHLGWTAALEQFRPILSYDELGGMLTGRQSDLYDALAGILGVEQLGDAAKRLKARVDARKAPGAAATNARKELQRRAAASTDSRAAKAATLLRKTKPDTSTLRALSTGGLMVDQGPLPRLRQLTELDAPQARVVATAVNTLRTARNALADAGAEVAEAAQARLEVLERALQVHSRHGDQDCPVCRQGHLDAGWAAQARALATSERARFGDIDRAHERFRDAFTAALDLLAPPPLSLDQAPVSELQGRLDTVRQAWARWSDLSPSCDAAGAEALCTHLDAQLAPLAAAVAGLRAAAADEVAARENEWQPLAGAIAGWCDDWDAWQTVAPTVQQLQDAEKWLKDNDLRLKNERLRPIENGARDAWRALRQESNVELGGLTLEGTSNRRRVRFTGAIDGEQVDSFAVLSQGELHALALSLFLPRATLAESPFRFVVLDDPVQAMDPAKVDGLVQLLGSLARTRQVVVFSHDDRLPAALRRGAHDATILEVNRAMHSVVTVVESRDPVSRYLADAQGLITECSRGRLPDDALRKTLPGLYRFAIEAAAKDLYFATQLASGAGIHDLEATWTATHTTRRRVLLAVFGEQPPDHLAQQWLRAPYRSQALRAAGIGLHRGLVGHPQDAHRHTARLVADIRSGAV